MDHEITGATATDVPDLADLADRRRHQYATYQPRFWNPAPDARERHEAFLGSLVAGSEADDGAIVRVARRGDAVVGFAIGTLVPHPPVYAPGGPTCLVDDFAVADEGDWPVLGPELLREVTAQARRRGAVQVVVVTAHLDAARREALSASGLAIGSEWWVGAL